MPAPVVTGPTTVPYGIAGFPNFNTDAGALAPAINTEIVKKSFPQMVAYLLPKGDTTLFALSSRMKEETAVQIEHGFFAKTMVFPSFTINAAALIGATALVAYDASQVIPNGLYKLVGTTTGGAGALTPQVTYASETVLVTAVSGNNITVTRGIGSTAAALLIDSTFVHVGNAFPNASLRPNSFLTKEIRVVNYTQIFRNAWAISGTVAAIQNAVGEANDVKSRKECAQYHAMDIEKSAIFGTRSISNGSGSTNAFYTMAGVIAQISDGQSSNLFLPGESASANISTANSPVNSVPTAGALSIVDFENWVDNTANMSYSPESGMERLLFVGKAAHKVLNRLFRFNVQYQVMNGTTEWGLRFSRVKLTRCDLIIVEHPLLNTNIMWSRMMIALDIPSLCLAYMTGRKTKKEEFNQNGTAVDNAIDAVGGSLLTELSILCKNPSGCGVFTNVQRAVSADGLTAT